MVQPTENIIILLAVLGAILYTVMKYLDKKRANPATVFDLTYAVALMGAVYGAIQAVSALNLQVDAMGLLMALVTGFSLNAGVSTVNSKIPIEWPISSPSVNAQDLADLKKRVADQDETIKKLQAK